MNLHRFDALARRAAAMRSPSRREALALTVTAFVAGLGLMPAAARKRRRKRKNNRKVKRNAFGCVDVGGKCRGKDGNCCSGICQGKKPKRGQKDTSRCVAHDEGGCRADQDFCAEGDVEVACGTAGVCLRTTGNASFCGSEEKGRCVVCATDADCEPEFGPGAACVVCAECQDEAGSPTGCAPAAV